MGDKSQRSLQTRLLPLLAHIQQQRPFYGGMCRKYILNLRRLWTECYRPDGGVDRLGDGTFAGLLVRLLKNKEHILDFDGDVCDKPAEGRLRDEFR